MTINLNMTLCLNMIDKHTLYADNNKLLI